MVEDHFTATGHYVNQSKITVNYHSKYPEDKRLLILVSKVIKFVTKYFVSNINLQHSSLAADVPIMPILVTDVGDEITKID